MLTKNKPKVGKCLIQYMDDKCDFDDFLYELDTLLQKKNPNGYWYAEVKNFGWLNQSGHRYLKATDGKTFLRQILPDTDCHFKVYAYPNGLAIQNYHHDSPTGNEWYYVVKITEEKYYGGV